MSARRHALYFERPILTNFCMGRLVVPPNCLHTDVDGTTAPTCVLKTGVKVHFGLRPVDLSAVIRVKPATDLTIGNRGNPQSFDIGNCNLHGLVPAHHRWVPVAAGNEEDTIRPWEDPADVELTFVVKGPGADFARKILAERTQNDICVISCFCR